MREESIARRYAAALFAQVTKTGTLDTAQSDLEAVAGRIANSPFLHSLNQPIITEVNKHSTLKEAFGSSVQPTTLAFLDLLVHKRRIKLLPEIQQEFSRLVRDYRKIATAHAASAIPLTEPQRQALVQSLEARTGKTIELTTTIDPTLIGGVLVRIGDTVYDGSVRGNLERLREQWLAGR